MGSARHFRHWRGVPPHGDAGREFRLLPVATQALSRIELPLAYLSAREQPPKGETAKLTVTDRASPLFPANAAARCRPSCGSGRSTRILLLRICFSPTR